MEEVGDAVDLFELIVHGLLPLSAFI
jgi:hypothetical protein